MRELQVSVRSPSMQFLRTWFKDAHFGGKTEKKTMPLPDKKYATESGFASDALYKRVSTEELEERGNSRAEEDQTSKITLFRDEETDMVSKKGSCWSQLKHSGMIQWGTRRQVRFLGRHEQEKLEFLSGPVKDTGFDVKEQNERREMTYRKRKKCDEQNELTKEVSHEIRVTRCKRNQNECSEVQRFKKPEHDRQKQLIVYSKKKHKVSIDRWSAERYKSAEENMLEVMKAKGAVFEKPIMRPELRLEARKLIGDTGLLDHLLKHMAGKVAPGGAERFRRRHNAEGAMEYWLESADLVKVRQEAGVQDPYWTPPPGWKPGDNPSQHPICARQIHEIKEEISKIKHEMQQLVSQKREEQLAIVTTTDSCLSDNSNLERGGSLVTMQEMYAELIDKKSKIEEQLKDISIALIDMEEQMMMIKSRVEPTSESDMPSALLPGPTTEIVAVGETKEQEGGHEHSEKKAAADEEEEDVKERSEAAKDRAAKIERLKSGFRICHPQAQGNFIWPNDLNIVVPTPSSVSSSSSLVKPLAEKRPISPATLTHVTMSFPSFLSPPPLINLNEDPPSYDPSMQQPPDPNAAAEKEASVKKETEMENIMVSSVLERKGWWSSVTKHGGGLP